MNMPIPASVVATVQSSPTWVKGIARATFLVLSIKGAMWVGVTWLSLRGFGPLF
jgi:hypothetical protein